MELAGGMKGTTAAALPGAGGAAGEGGVPPFSKRVRTPAAGPTARGGGGPMAPPMGMRSWEAGPAVGAASRPVDREGNHVVAAGVVRGQGSAMVVRKSRRPREAKLVSTVGQAVIHQESGPVVGGVVGPQNRVVHGAVGPPDGDRFG